MAELNLVTCSVVLNQAACLGALSSFSARLNSTLSQDKLGRHTGTELVTQLNFTHSGYSVFSERLASLLHKLITYNLVNLATKSSTRSSCFALGVKDPSHPAMKCFKMQTETEGQPQILEIKLCLT